MPKYTFHITKNKVLLFVVFSCPKSSSPHSRLMSIYCLIPGGEKVLLNELLVHPPLLFVLFYSANHPLFSSFIPRLTNLVPLTKIISAYGLLHSYQSWSQISFIFMSVLLYLLLPSFLCVVAKSLPCFCLSQCTSAVEETSTFIVHKTPFSSKSTALKLRPTSVRPSHPTAVEDIMPIRVGASSH